MAVTIVIPTPLRQFADGKSEIEVEAATAGEALKVLTTQFADLRKHLYNDQDALRNFVNVYVGEFFGDNLRSVRSLHLISFDNFRAVKL